MNHAETYEPPTSTPLPAQYGSPTMTAVVPTAFAPVMAMTAAVPTAFAPVMAMTAAAPTAAAPTAFAPMPAMTTMPAER